MSEHKDGHGHEHAHHHHHRHDCGNIFGCGDEKGTGPVREDIKDAAFKSARRIACFIWTKSIRRFLTAMSRYVRVPVAVTGISVILFTSLSVNAPVRW